MSDDFWLPCCQCGERFALRGELAEQARAACAPQPNHAPEKEAGVCDACYEKEFRRAISTVGPRRRWFRFSLRTLFVLLTVFACWLGWNVHRSQERMRILRQLTLQRAIASINWQDGSKGEKAQALAWWPFGACQIASIFLEDGHFTNADVDRLQALLPTTNLHRCHRVADELQFLGYLRAGTE